MATAETLNVLFLCTANSARSIMAEALANDPRVAGGRLRAFSAGSHPAGELHPLALELLQQHRLPTAGLRSKSWDEFARPDAPHMHVVVTVCDQARGEPCPVWPGHPTTAHWGVPDPAAVTGSDEARRRAFRDAFLLLQRRIDLFASLPFNTLSPMALRDQLDRIGQTR